MPITVNYQPPFAALGQAAYDVGEGQAQQQLGQTFLQGATGLAQILGQAQTRALQNRQLEQTQQHQTDLLAMDRRRLEQQQAQFEAAAQREREMQTQRLEATSSEAALRQTHEMDQAILRSRLEYRNRWGFEPSELGRTDMARLNQLEQGMAQTQEMAATQVISPSLQQAMVAHLSPELAQLQGRRAIAELQNERRRIDMEQREWERRQFTQRDPVTGLDFPGSRDHQGNGTLYSFPRPTSTAGQTPTPSQIGTLEHRVQQQHMVPDPENPNRRIVDPNLTQEQLNQGIVELDRRNRVGLRWGENPVSQTLRQEQTRVRAAAPDQERLVAHFQRTFGDTAEQARRRAHELAATPLDRLEQISNLTLGFTDPAWMQRYQTEIQQLMQNLHASHPQSWARIRDQLMRVQTAH